MNAANAGRALASLAAAATLAGCSTLGDLGSILGGAPGTGSEVRAEIQEVDEWREEIAFETQDRRTGVVSFDERTRVVYQNREYPVTALERGDLVRMRLSETAGGELYTDLIEVEQSADQRTSDPWGSGQNERLEGNVAWIDQDRGQFLLDLRSGAEVMVNLPQGAPNQMVYEFQRLDRGDYVRIEARPISNQQVEIVRFGWTE